MSSMSIKLIPLSRLAAIPQRRRVSVSTLGRRCASSCPIIGSSLSKVWPMTVTRLPATIKGWIQTAGRSIMFAAARLIGKQGSPPGRPWLSAVGSRHWWWSEFCDAIGCVNRAAVSRR